MILHDEQGKVSAARVLLVSTTIFTFLVIGVDVGFRIGVGSAVYGLLGGMITAFAAWAAGPRIAEYLGPQVGAIASGIAQGRATKRKYGPSTEAFDDLD